jgi:hypothetical protein
MQNEMMNLTQRTSPALQLSHDAIASLAAQTWEREGRPGGRDLEFWLRAEQQLVSVRQQEAGKAGTRNLSNPKSEPRSR